MHINLWCQQVLRQKKVAKAGENDGTNIALVITPEECDADTCKARIPEEDEKSNISEYD